MLAYVGSYCTVSKFIPDLCHDVGSYYTVSKFILDLCLLYLIVTVVEF